MLGVWNQNPNEQGTDDAALAAVLGALNSASSTGAVSDAKTAMSMVKQIVTNSEAAVQLANHDTNIFPASSELDCVLTAHASANTLTAWAEIVDTTGGTPVTLSSVFAACNGHITAMIAEIANQDNAIYMVEISYGSAKTPISSWRIISKSSFVSPTGVSACRGEHIPLGETVYYRMMCETAGAKTLKVHFRYFCHA